MIQHLKVYLFESVCATVINNNFKNYSSVKLFSLMSVMAMQAKANKSQQ